MPVSVRITKRVFDIVMSLFVIVALFPIWAVIGFLIWKEDHGSIFYKQRRVGLHSKEFILFKFRTMIMDAESKTGVGLTKVGDARITKVGDFLRKTRLDEIPNFINVLLGDMSVVGPRAERREIYQKLEADFPMVWKRTQFIKPGITGFAQIELNSDGSIDEASRVHPHLPEGDVGKPEDIVRYKMYYDFAYAIKLLSFRNFVKADAIAILKTPYIMFFNRNVV